MLWILNEEGIDSQTWSLIMYKEPFNNYDIGTVGILLTFPTFD